VLHVGGGHPDQRGLVAQHRAHGRHGFRRMKGPP
jgi:hypothetical protein